MSYYPAAGNTVAITLTAGSANFSLAAGGLLLANVKAGDTLHQGGRSEIVASITDNQNGVLAGNWPTGGSYTGTDFRFNHTGDGWQSTVPFHERVVELLAALDTQTLGGSGLPYIFDTATADADPGTGKIRLGSATQNAATVLRADLSDGLGRVVTGFLDTWDDSTSGVKGKLFISHRSDPTKWLAFNVVALASPSGYKNITIANTAASSASPFLNGDEVALWFIANGDLGSAPTLAPVSAKTAAFSVTAADIGVIFAFNGTAAATASLVAGASVANGFCFRIKNTSNFTLTLDPNGAELIDGATTLAILAKQECLVVWNGAAWESFGLAKRVAISKTVTSSGNPGIFLPAGYSRFTLHFSDVVFSSQTPTIIGMRIAKDAAGTSHDSGANYSRSSITVQSSVTGGITLSENFAVVGINHGNSATSPAKGDIDFSPGAAARATHWTAHVGTLEGITNGSQQQVLHGYHSVGRATGLIFFSATTGSGFASGTFHLEGIV